jgi:hypothetical protein
MWSVELFNNDGGRVNKQLMVFETRYLALEWASYMLDTYKGVVADFTITKYYTYEEVCA